MYWISRCHLAASVKCLLKAWLCVPSSLYRTSMRPNQTDVCITARSFLKHLRFSTSSTVFEAAVDPEEIPYNREGEKNLSTTGAVLPLTSVRLVIMMSEDFLSQWLSLCDTPSLWILPFMWFVVAGNWPGLKWRIHLGIVILLKYSQAL